MSGHRFVLKIEDGYTSWELICPDDGQCVSSNTCGSCGRAVGDTETDACYDCPDKSADCWAQSWVGSAMVDEVLRGVVTLEIPVRCEYNGDGFEAHIEGPALVRPETVDAA